VLLPDEDCFVMVWAAGHTLDVLAAGAVLPPNPGELIESRAMDAVLERAKSGYDLVVIDTPPLTAVLDAFPLLSKVDGVVIVGRVGHSRRDAAEQLHQVLASSGAPLLGGDRQRGEVGRADPVSGGRWVVWRCRVGQWGFLLIRGARPDRRGLSRRPALLVRALRSDAGQATAGL
jgi:MinD-like ATPase involved in chromosome partitioning or flagellar assembly